MQQQIVVGVLASVVLGFAGSGLADGSDVSRQSRPQPVAALEQKTVVVTGQNAAEAKFKAENQNPGWRAISAKKADPFDPKSNLWEVLLQR